MKKIVTVAAATMLVASATTARAQDPGAVVSYLALATTPIGALPPALSSSMLGGKTEGWGVQTRYGHISADEAIHNIGVGVDFSALRGNVGITLGYAMPQAEGADSYMLVGAGWQSRLASSDLGAAKLNVGVQTDVGYSKPVQDVTALSAAVSIPVAFVAGSGSWSYAPFLSPGFGYGRLSAAGESESGTRFMLGGGLALNSPARGMAFNVGLQKVFIEDGEMQFGIGLTWHPSR